MTIEYRVNRRVGALFTAMSSDFLLRQQFVTDPAQVLAEYVDGESLSAEIAAAANRLLYSVLSNPGLLRWISGYASQHKQGASAGQDFDRKFARAVARHGDEQTVLTLIAGASDTQDRFTTQSRLLLAIIAALALRGRSVFDGTEGDGGTGTEVSPGTGTDVSPGTGTEVSPGTGTEVSPGDVAFVSASEDIEVLREDDGTEMSPGTGTEVSPGTGTEVSPGTGTEVSPGEIASFRLEETEIFREDDGTEMSPGTGTEVSPGTGTEVSPGGGLRFDVTIAELVSYAQQLRSSGALELVG
jgi:hypothetical protein